jgi:SagB-type dehydrogenase family enzyme
VTDAAPTPATLGWAPFVYGEAGVDVDDAAEAYHEASKLSPLTTDHRLPGRLLAVSRPLRASAARAVKRHPGAPSRRLPRPDLGSTTLATALLRRRSTRDFGREPLAARKLAGLLHAGYGITGWTTQPPQPLRAAPSGGALYPLDVYPVVVAVRGFAPGIYHFDPLEHRLELLRDGEPSQALAKLTVYPELLERAAVVVFIAAMFWRSRFKYGLRGYRFTLLEAGHVVQNMLLAAAALDLAAVPVGGFYDRIADDYLSLDGVNESVVYALSVGRRAT